MRGHAHLIGAYVPGNTLVHRTPLWLKFTAVVALSITVLFVQALPVTVLALLAVLGLGLLAGLSAAATLRPLLRMAPVLLVLGAYQWWLNGAETAVVVVLNIATCVLAARLLILTTPGQRLLDGMVSAAKPFRFLGADPERFGLTLSLMMRSIPYLLGSVADVRDAARARGLHRRPAAVVVPVIVNAVAYAHQTGEALTARGLGDPEDTTGRHPKVPAC